MTEEYDGSEPLKDQRREQFCHEYIIDFNQSQACIRAGYAKSSARNQGARLMANDYVQRRVKHLTQKVRERTQIDADWVLQRLALMAMADPTQILDELGNVKDPADWPAGVKAIVSGFDVNTIMDKDGNTGGMLIQKLRTSDPLKILETLGRHKAVQAFKDQVEVDAGENLVSAILAGRKRARGEADE